LRHYLGLEAAHLTGRSRLRRHGASADNEAHYRIASEPIGIVAVFVSGQASKHRLTKLRDQPMTTVAACPCVGKNVASHLLQPKSVVEFAKSQQASIGGDPGPMKFQLQPSVEIEPQNSAIRVTRWVCHGRSLDV
jgi:hypothetical protein